MVKSRRRCMENIIEEYAGIVMAVIIVYAMILIFMTILMGVMKV
jgi:hypothetical protein